MAHARTEESAGAVGGGSESAVKKPRYSKHAHKSVFAAALKGPPFNGVVPKKKDELELLASKISFDSTTHQPWGMNAVLRISKNLAKEWSDITPNRRK